MRNSHFLNRFPFLSWHIFPRKPMNFLVKSLEIWSNRFFSHLFIIIFSMFFSYLHKQFSSFLPYFPHFSPFSLGFPHFSSFSPGFPQVFPRFSPPFRSLPGFTVGHAVPWRLAPLAERGTCRAWRRSPSAASRQRAGPGIRC